MTLWSMIKDYSHINFLGHRVFDKVIVEAPMKMIAKMPNEACFYFVINGTAKVLTPTKEIELKSEEGVVLQCGNYLNEYFCTNNIEYCEAFAVHLYPDILKHVYQSEIPDFLLNVKHVKPVKYSKFKSTQLMAAYVNSMKFYFDNPELVSDELLKLKIKELIILLAKTDNLEGIKNLFSGLFNTHEYDFKEIIEANVYNNLSIEELAFLTNLSLSSFKRVFKKHYDTSPARYIRERKLAKASKLLKGTRLRISSIAYDSGFNDLAHFSKVFQKHYHLSPSKYRLD